MGDLEGLPTSRTAVNADDEPGRRCPRGCGLTLVFDHVNRRWVCSLCLWTDRPIQRISPDAAAAHRAMDAQFQWLFWALAVAGLVVVLAFLTVGQPLR